MRSELEIAKVTSVVLPPITPDATPADAVSSALVDTSTPVLDPPVAAPNLNPARVTVTVELAAIDPPVVVMTIEVVLGALMAVKLMPPIETVPLGGLLEEKKPDG